MINEKLYKQNLSSGAKCYIIPKKDYVQKQVIISISYGSVDNEFKTNIDEEFVKVPKGIAHYLEHKMFEDENSSVFNTFSELGSFVNAHTSSDVTSYYFNCIDKFDDCLNALLGFVQRPYFTDENVEKEKGIIASEIKMYEDSPSFMLYYNMLEALYVNHPVKDNIAGTIESIAQINKDLLYTCYNTFYTSSNMTIVCVGDLDPSEFFKKVNSLIEIKPQKEILRYSISEPKVVSKHEIVKQMPVSMPIYMIGIKDNDYNLINMPQNTVAAKLLLDIILGESSPLYQRLYSEGISDDSLSFDCVRGKSYAHNIVLGVGKEPYRIKEALFNEIKRLKKDGIPDEHFERIKKKHIGKFVRIFNSVDMLALSQADLSSKQTDLFALMDAFDNVTKDDVVSYLHKNLIEENAVISIIKP